MFFFILNCGGARENAGLIRSMNTLCTHILQLVHQSMPRWKRQPKIVTHPQPLAGTQKVKSRHDTNRQIRDAYRFQWSLPGARACLSCGSHLMLRGEADLALPQLDLEEFYSRAMRGGGGDRGGGETTVEEGQQRPPSLHVSAYARLTLARLASQVRRRNLLCF